MGWFDKLDSLVKVTAKFKSFISINSNNDNRQVHIHIGDVGKTSQKDLLELKQVLQETLKSAPAYYVSSETVEEKVELIDSFSHDLSEDPSFLFVKEKLPKKDFPIWYAALILRKCFKTGENQKVKKLKDDIRTAHRERGSNIANLCSSGYLESQIIPLYEHVIEAEKGEKYFNDIYEKIVTEMPLAVFVSQLTSQSELKEEIKRKISQVREYGWNTVHVHGLGIENVEKTKKVCHELETEIKDIDEVEINSNKQHIIVTFKIKE